MKMATRDLNGVALDWAVEKADSVRIVPFSEIEYVRCNDLYFPHGNEHGAHYEPYYKAYSGADIIYGPSVSIAIKRLRIAMVLGQVVDVPDDIVNTKGI